MSLPVRLTDHRPVVRTVLAAALAGCLLAAAAVPAGAAPTWLGPVQLSADTTCPFLAASHSIASTKDGIAIAAWQTRDNGCVGATRIEVAVRPAGPGTAFGAPVVLSDPALESTEPNVAIDAAGNAIVVWVQDGAIRFSRRPAGGSFAPAQTIAGAGPLATEPAVAIAGDTAVVGWVRAGAAEVAVKPAGSDAFGAPATFATAAEPAHDVEVAVNAAGAALLTWQTIGTPLDTLRAAARPAGGAFSALAPVFTTTNDTDNIARPLVAIDPAGRGTLLWSYFDAARGIHVVESAARPAGGDVGPVQHASDPTVDSGPLGSIDLAIDGDNTAVAVWWALTMQAAVRPAGGSFGPVIKNISALNFVITRPRVALDPGGRAIAVWLSPGGTTSAVQSAVLPKGAASFGAVAVARTASLADGELLDGATPMALDDQGNAVTMWRRKVGPAPVAPALPALRLESAWLDAAPPAGLTIAVPGSGRLDVPVSMSAGGASDRLSPPVALTWSFGDGGVAAGASVSHTYRRAGLFSVSVTATDAVGNAATLSSPISIPASTASSALTTGPDPRLAISGLRIAPNAFRAATKGPTVRPANRKPWSRVSYRISVNARVRFSFERPVFGRRSGARCVKQTRRNRTARRCVRYVPVKGAFTRTRRAGGDRFTFTGRVRGRRLKSGRYRLIAKASANGRSGASKRVSFRIRPARPPARR